MALRVANPDMHIVAKMPGSGGRAMTGFADPGLGGSRDAAGSIPMMMKFPSAHFVVRAQGSPMSVLEKVWVGSW